MNVTIILVLLLFIVACLLFMLLRNKKETKGGAPIILYMDDNEPVASYYSERIPINNPDLNIEYLCRHYPRNCFYIYTRIYGVKDFSPSDVVLKQPANLKFKQTVSDTILNFFIKDDKNRKDLIKYFYSIFTVSKCPDWVETYVKEFTNSTDMCLQINYNFYKIVDSDSIYAPTKRDLEIFIEFIKFKSSYNAVLNKFMYMYPHYTADLLNNWPFDVNHKKIVQLFGTGIKYFSDIYSHNVVNNCHMLETNDKNVSLFDDNNLPYEMNNGDMIITNSITSDTVYNYKTIYDSLSKSTIGNNPNTNLIINELITVPPNSNKSKKLNLLLSRMNISSYVIKTPIMIKHPLNNLINLVRINNDNSYGLNILNNDDTKITKIDLYLESLYNNLDSAHLSYLKDKTKSTFYYICQNIRYVSTIMNKIYINMDIPAQLFIYKFYIHSMVLNINKYNANEQFLSIDELIALFGYHYCAISCYNNKIEIFYYFDPISTGYKCTNNTKLITYERYIELKDDTSNINRDEINYFVNLNRELNLIKINNCEDFFTDFMVEVYTTAKTITSNYNINNKIVNKINTVVFTKVNFNKLGFTILFYDNIDNLGTLYKPVDDLFATKKQTTNAYTYDTEELYRGSLFPVFNNVNNELILYKTHVLSLLYYHKINNLKNQDIFDYYVINKYCTDENKIELQNFCEEIYNYTINSNYRYRKYLDIQFIKSIIAKSKLLNYDTDDKKLQHVMNTEYKNPLDDFNAKIDAFIADIKTNQILDTDIIYKEIVKINNEKYDCIYTDNYRSKIRKLLVDIVCTSDNLAGMCAKINYIISPSFYYDYEYNVQILKDEVNNLTVKNTNPFAWINKLEISDLCLDSFYSKYLGHLAFTPFKNKFHNDLSTKILEVLNRPDLFIITNGNDRLIISNICQIIDSIEPVNSLNATQICTILIQKAGVNLTDDEVAKIQKIGVNIELNDKTQLDYVEFSDLTIEQLEFNYTDFISKNMKNFIKIFDIDFIIVNNNNKKIICDDDHNMIFYITDLYYQIEKKYCRPPNLPKFIYGRRRYEAFKIIKINELAAIDIFTFLHLVQCYSYLNYLIQFYGDSAKPHTDKLINILADIYYKRQNVRPYADCVSVILGFDIRNIKHAHIGLLHSLIGEPAESLPPFEFSSKPYIPISMARYRQPPDVKIINNTFYNDMCYNLNSYKF